MRGCCCIPEEFAYCGRFCALPALSLCNLIIGQHSGGGSHNSKWAAKSLSWLAGAASFRKLAAHGVVFAEFPVHEERYRCVFSRYIILPRLSLLLLHTLHKHKTYFSFELPLNYVQMQFGAALLFFSCYCSVKLSVDGQKCINMYVHREKIT